MRRRPCSACWQRPVATLAVAALIAGCASVNLPRPRWPFAARPAPAPLIVDELVFEAPTGVPVSAFPQYFRRNTLIVDMTAAATAGVVTIRPKTPFGWPVRIALRVRPGVFAALELRGAQRLVLPVVASGRRATVDLELPPGFVPTRGDEPIELRWGMAVPAVGSDAQSAPTGR